MIERILKDIEAMGYIAITPKNISPSYYRLKDGTIIEAHIVVESIASDPKHQAGDYSIRMSNRTIAYVPKEARNPKGEVPASPADIANGIIDEDVEFEPLLESFNIYELSNGFTLSIKTIASQIKKTRYHTEQGEPIYTVSLTPITKSKKTK